jgi:hypothetical protein
VDSFLGLLILVKDILMYRGFLNSVIEIVVKSDVKVSARELIVGLEVSLVVLSSLKVL